MKLVILLVLLCLLSAVAVAHDLSAAARKERSRRHAVMEARGGKKAPLFSDADLAAYHRATAERSIEIPRSTARPLRAPRDLEKERAYWHKEKEKHRRELAQLDARIRRLKWRLSERKARRRPGERLREDPVEKVLEDSLSEIETQRHRLVEDFFERARRAGALPGWLR